MADEGIKDEVAVLDRPAVADKPKVFGRVKRTSDEPIFVNELKEIPTEVPEDEPEHPLTVNVPTMNTRRDFSK